MAGHGDAGRRTEHLSARSTQGAQARADATRAAAHIEDADEVAAHGDGMARLDEARVVLRDQMLWPQNVPELLLIPHTGTEAARDRGARWEVIQADKVKDDPDAVRRSQHCGGGHHAQLLVGRAIHPTRRDGRAIHPTRRDGRAIHPTRYVYVKLLKLLCT